MKAFLYARVSTGDQNEGMQVREMTESCQRRQWDFEVFPDAAQSGSKESRPELDRMMALVRRGKCDVVMVYRFDRFARSLRFLLNALEEFRALNVAFISLHENIDTTTPAGRMMFQMVGAIAEFEREMIRERVRSGIAHARSQGVRLGRPRVDADSEKIHALRAQGLSLREIGKQVGISYGTVLLVLKGVKKTVKNRG